MKKNIPCQIANNPVLHCISGEKLFEQSCLRFPKLALTTLATCSLFKETVLPPPTFCSLSQTNDDIWGSVFLLIMKIAFHRFQDFYLISSQNLG